MCGLVAFGCYPYSLDFPESIATLRTNTVLVEFVPALFCTEFLHFDRLRDFSSVSGFGISHGSFFDTGRAPGFPRYWGNISPGSIVSLAWSVLSIFPA